MASTLRMQTALSLGKSSSTFRAHSGSLVWRHKCIGLSNHRHLTNDFLTNSSKTTVKTNYNWLHECMSVRNETIHRQIWLGIQRPIFKCLQKPKRNRLNSHLESSLTIPSRLNRPSPDNTATHFWWWLPHWLWETSFKVNINYWLRKEFHLYLRPNNSRLIINKCDE